MIKIKTFCIHNLIWELMATQINSNWCTAVTIVGLDFKQIHLPYGLLLHTSFTEMVLLSRYTKGRIMYK